MTPTDLSPDAIKQRQIVRAAEAQKSLADTMLNLEKAARENKTAKGPRNVPAKSPAVKARRAQKAARKVNR